MDKQFIHLNSVVKLLRDPAHGLATSLYRDVGKLGYELASQCFIGGGDKVEYARYIPIGTRDRNSGLCNINCENHPYYDGTTGDVRGTGFSVDEYRGIRPFK